MSIHEACRSGDLQSVKDLIAKEPSLVNADDEHEWRPIFHAALQQHLDIVRVLIDAGADVGAHDGYALHYGAEVPNNKPIVRLLIESGALDAHTLPPNNLLRQFLAAVFLANDSRVESMLGLHPDLASLPDGRGDLAIHHAARNGDTAIVALLIQFGANVNATNDRNHTVLYCAGGHGHLETVRCLLNAGADALAKFAHDGKTLLDWLGQYPDDQRLSRVADLLKEENLDPPA